MEYCVRLEKERDTGATEQDLAFPAHLAAFQGKLDELQHLVETGIVNVNERDDQGSYSYSLSASCIFLLYDLWAS